MERSPFQQRASRVLHYVGDLTSRSSSAIALTTALVVFLIVLCIFGLPGRWQEIFSTVTAAITLVMLFVIQHTQSRQQAVLQLKLDELIRSSPHADDLLVHLEVAHDTELIEREEELIAHHEALREVDLEEGET